jgi:putative effector of murein hydrolase LrgA (UPF0299 family)
MDWDLFISISKMKKGLYFTALKIALFVGTILNLINNYDNIVHHNWSWILFYKISSTYLVPFFVSLYSSYRALKK